ncbi:TIGR02450 family Trp-rich protein [Salinivibrio sp. SS3]
MIVEYDEDGVVISCVLESVLSKKEYPIDWRELKSDEKWRQV